MLFIDIFIKSKINFKNFAHATFSHYATYLDFFTYLHWRYFVTVYPYAPSFKLNLHFCIYNLIDFSIFLNKFVSFIFYDNYISYLKLTNNNSQFFMDNDQFSFIYKDYNSIKYLYYAIDDRSNQYLSIYNLMDADNIYN